MATVKVRMEELKKAIQAAGEELRDTYDWGLDDDDDRKPVLETIFAKVLLKHVAPVIDPATLESTRKAKIAALRAELAALSRSTRAESLYIIYECGDK